MARTQQVRNWTSATLTSSCSSQCKTAAANIPLKLQHLWRGQKYSSHQHSQALLILSLEQDYSGKRSLVLLPKRMQTSCQQPAALFVTTKPGTGTTDIILLCPMDNCYAAKKQLCEEISTQQEKKQTNYKKLKTRQTQQTINHQDFTKINRVKQIHSSQVHIQNFFGFNDTELPKH